MRHLALLAALLITTLATSAEQYVYVKEGRVVTPPRALPSIGVHRTTGQAVLGLHGTTDTTKAACGWYRVLPPLTTCATNQVIATTTYQVLKDTVRTIHTYKQRTQFTLQDRITQLFSTPELRTLSDDDQVKQVINALATAVTNKLQAAHPDQPIITPPVKGDLFK